MTKGIKISGFGGQGVILAGIIVGRAASILDGNYAAMTQTIGPEARGGSCSAQIIISGDNILYPYVKRPDVLIAMSQEAGTRFLPDVADDATVLIEEDLVSLKGGKPGVKAYAIPATRFAEEIGAKITQNIVMVGFFTAVTKLISFKAARDTVKSVVPPGTETVNLTAFDRGYEYGQALLAPSKG